MDHLRQNKWKMKRDGSTRVREICKVWRTYKLQNLNFVVMINSVQVQKFDTEHWRYTSILTLRALDLLPFTDDLCLVHYHYGAWCGVVVKALRHWSDGPRINSRWCHWIFQWHISFRPYHGPGVDSAPRENEYQEHFVGVKAAGTWGWQTHHLHVPNVMESGSLNLLEPSGPHRACCGTALPLHLPLQSSQHDICSCNRRTKADPGGRAV